jgi:cell migration-inducing and hyaluronan-binding protein
MPLETTTRLWSDPDSWDSGQVPKEGENVVILSGRNFVYDLDESPMYNYIEVNGQVTFKPDAETLHLRAKYLFVRAGRIAIGTSDEPHMGNVQITLSGEKDNKQIAYTNAIEGGNKVLANTGIVEMYG